MPARLRLALLGALLTLLAAPGLARAAEPGVNVYGIPDDAEIARVQASGAKVVRMFVNWPDLEPSKGGYDSYALGVYDHILGTFHASGIKVVLVLWQSPTWASGSTDRLVPPLNPVDYAGFAGALAARWPGLVTGYEIWNEEDADEYWHAPVSAVRYTAMLTAASAAIHAADPAAKVVLGPTTGNNYDFLQQVYDAGGKGSFDAVAVHTDTACLTAAPSDFYRDATTGRLGQYTFLGYREVHATMLANGDDKPIWMTELGWSSATSTCDRGVKAGTKPAGVGEAAQASDLKQAFHCMASDPYVQMGIVYTMHDRTDYSDELNKYGLIAPDGRLKPAWTAFHDVAVNGDQLTGPCGDFDAPTINIASPTDGQQFAGSLLIEASANDHGGTGLGRITYRIDDDPQEIRNFTTGLKDDGVVSLDWQGAKKLANGPHKITVVALDANGNTASKSVTVTKVDPSQLAATEATRVALKGSVRCKGRVCRVSGRVDGPGHVSIDGKVQVLWQANRKGKWKVIHKGLRPANKAFTFTQRLRFGGRWRVQVKYLGKPPLRASRSKTVAFRVG